MSGSSNCKVKGCSSEALHELPGDVEKRRVWTEALNLEVEYSPTNQVLCSEHYQILRCIDVGSPKVCAGSPSTALSNTSGGSNDDDNPPRSSKKSKALPKQATAFMRSWLSQHLHHPYPTEQEKIKIAAQMDLTYMQVTNWFINARRRILLAMLHSSNGVSASPSPPLSESFNASESRQDVIKAKNPRKITPTMAEVENYGGFITSDNADSTTRNTTNVSSPTLASPSTVSTDYGVDSNVCKSHKKSAALRAPSLKNLKSKSQGKSILKVVVPAASSCRIKLKNRPRTITTTNSSHQPIGSNGVCNTQPGKRTKKITKPHPHRLISVQSASTPATKVVPSTLTSGETSRTTVNHSTPAHHSRSTRCVPGEDLLDSLYRELYLKPTKLEEVKMEPFQQRIDSSQPSNASERTSYCVPNASYDIGTAEITTTHSHATQTSFELKHSETQTAQDVHSAIISHEMYKTRPDWVTYHTGLKSYKQFKQVLNSLGLNSCDLTSRSSSSDEMLCVEDQLLMALMKLRRGEPDLGLSIVFGVSKETVKKTVMAWIEFMYQEWSTSGIWATQGLTAYKIFGPNGVRLDPHPSTGSTTASTGGSSDTTGSTTASTSGKPTNSHVQDRVSRLFRILSIPAQNHRPIADCILFVCCILFDFRNGVITM